MPVSEAVMLEYKATKGESLKYKAHVETTQQISAGEEMKKATTIMDVIMSQNCTDISPEGNINLDVVMEGGKVHLEGQEPQDIPTTGQVMKLHMRKNGSIVSSDGNTPFEQPAFPEKSLRIGDKWASHSKIAIPGKPDPEQLDYNYTLSDIVNLNGYECSKIALQSEKKNIFLAEGINQYVESAGTIHFAHKEGKLVKSEVKTFSKIETAEGEMSTAINVVMELN